MDEVVKSDLFDYMVAKVLNEGLGELHIFQLNPRPDHVDKLIQFINIFFEDDVYLLLKDTDLTSEYENMIELLEYFKERDPLGEYDKFYDEKIEFLKTYPKENLLVVLNNIPESASLVTNYFYEKNFIIIDELIELYSLLGKYKHLHKIFKDNVPLQKKYREGMIINQMKPHHLLVLDYMISNMDNYLQLYGKNYLPKRLFSLIAFFHHFSTNNIPMDIQLQILDYFLPFSKEQKIVLKNYIPSLIWKLQHRNKKILNVKKEFQLIRDLNRLVKGEAVDLALWTIENELKKLNEYLLNPPLNFINNNIGF